MRLILILSLMVTITGCHPNRRRVYYVTIGDKDGSDKFLTNCGKPDITIQNGHYYVHTFGGDGGADTYFVTDSAVSMPTTHKNETCELNPEK